MVCHLGVVIVVRVEVEVVENSLLIFLLMLNGTVEIKEEVSGTFTSPIKV